MDDLETLAAAVDSAFDNQGIRAKNLDPLSRRL